MEFHEQPSFLPANQIPFFDQESRDTVAAYERSLGPLIFAYQAARTGSDRVFLDVQAGAQDGTALISIGYGYFKKPHEFFDTFKSQLFGYCVNKSHPLVIDGNNTTIGGRRTFFVHSTADGHFLFRKVGNDHLKQLTDLLKIDLRHPS